MKKREFSFYFAEGKKLFHIVARIPDEPGALGKVLNVLGPRVNFIGTSTYNLHDKSALFSGYAEALRQDESAEQLRSLVTSSKAAIDVTVMPGQDGILVDTYHTGFEAYGEEMMLVRRKAMSGMIAQIYKMLGSGGETLLYEEGKAIGRSNMEETVKTIGKERVGANMAYLRKRLRALGWGDVDAPIKGDRTRLQIRDCFECSDSTDSRTGCHFFRGYIVGNRGAMDGRDPAAEEVKCVLRGDEVCEFVISPHA
ncbi:MAG TPA: V4R domain-containing protein [Nitrososphaerales archaeon]|nr:V4R domain-containing protein [Nitrososphaerales archaeon]